MSSINQNPRAGANGYAIAGFVLSLSCCSPLGITFSAIALAQIKQNPDQEGKGMAIAGFVTALACCSPAGIILSSIALSQINKDPNQKGKGLAIAGLVYGIVVTVLLIIYYTVILSTGLLDTYDY